MEPISKNEYLDEYEDGSWDAWEIAVANREKRVGGLHAEFLPSPELIKRRAAILRWLRDRGFNSDLLKAVMVEQKPGFREVVRLIRQYGNEKAVSIVTQMNQL